MIRTGRLAWLRETSGVLQTRDRVVLLGQAIAYGLMTLPAELRRIFGIAPRRVAAIDLERLSPPDSPAASMAENQLQHLSSAMVVNHSYRTYWWGALMASHDGIAFDREIVYVASLMHDLYVDKPRSLERPHCFTLPAVHDVELLGQSVGWDKRRIETAAEAVTLHLNLIPPRVSAEARAVFTGARLDITGFRLEEVSGATRDTILGRYPRLNLKRETTPLFEVQSKENRGCRIDFYTRVLGANWWMHRAPFEE